MVLYNPVTTFTQTINPGSVTANLAAAINGGPGAANRDVGGSATVTISIASPAVVSWTAHGQVAGNRIVFTTTGALPTGLTSGTPYYVISAGLTANSFEVSATVGGAVVNTSGTQSGTQTATAGAYIAGDDVWFYYMWGSSPGLSTINSLTAPTATNGGGTTGPILPATYTHYVPAFVIRLVGSATLQPGLPQGGTSNYRINGNRVFFTNTPLISSGIGFPSGTVDFTTWLPVAQRTVDIYADLELTFATTGIGGAVLGTVDGNFWNASLYAGVSAFPCAMDGTIPGVVLPTRQFTLTYSKSSGTFSTSQTFIGPVGYTFPN